MAPSEFFFLRMVWYELTNGGLCSSTNEKLDRSNFIEGVSVYTGTLPAVMY